MRDRIVRHQMLLQELGEDEGRKVVDLLDTAQADLLDQLNRRLATAKQRGYDLGPRTTRRVAELQQSFGKIVDDWRSAAYKVNRDDMIELTADELAYQQDLFDRTIPKTLNVEMVLPDPRQLRSIVTTEPFDGTPLSKWYGKMSSGLKGRLDAAVRTGMVEGQTIDQIARRIRGTRANQFKDGVIEATRREARAIARTAVNHTSNRTREKLYEENADVVKGVQWVATLDARTCPECMALDGRVFKLDNVKRRPPAHVACRCTLVPVLRSFREMGFKAREAPAGTRESMNGKVSSKTTYPEWLKGQPKWVQNRALGKKRAELWRSGKVQISQFTNENGRRLNLEQLKKVEKRNAAPKKPPKKAPAEPKTRAPKAAVLIEEARPVSDQFRGRVEKSLEGVPVKVANRVNRNGGAVRIGDSVTEIDPTLKGVTPRGWPDGSTWDEAEGFFWTSEKAVVFAEKHKFNGKWMQTSPERIAGGVPHEYGHMVDEFGRKEIKKGQMFSKENAFRKAWGKDIKAMSVEDSRRLDYFTGNVSADAARSEAFAEAFAIEYTGTGAGHWQVDLFRKSFPETMRIIKKLVEE